MTAAPFPIRHSPAREAALVLAAAVVFGFTYTALTGKGFFGPASVKSARPEPARISFHDARTLHRRGEALFLDSRLAGDYGLGRIPGSVNLPLKDFGTDGSILELIPKDQLLVTYCDGEDCNSSLELAVKLDSAGYRNVRVFFGGWKEWVRNGQPTEP